MTCSDYRRIARENLAGNWGKSILVTFVAAVFGALLTGGSFSFNIDAEILAEKSIKPLTQYLRLGS